MARQPSARVRLYREKIDQVLLAVADGAMAVGEATVREANPPDAKPHGVGLVTNGGWLAYYDGRKVGGGGLDGKQPKPPRSARISKSLGIVVLAGFGFPGRFQEFGTAHHAAQPFFSPAVDRVLPRAHDIMRQHVRPKLGAIR